MPRSSLLSWSQVMLRALFRTHERSCSALLSLLSARARCSVAKKKAAVLYKRITMWADGKLYTPPPSTDRDLLKLSWQAGQQFSSRRYTVPPSAPLSPCPGQVMVNVGTYIAARNSLPSLLPVLYNQTFAVVISIREQRMKSSAAADERDRTFSTSTC